MKASELHKTVVKNGASLKKEDGIFAGNVEDSVYLLIKTRFSASYPTAVDNNVLPDTSVKGRRRSSSKIASWNFEATEIIRSGWIFFSTTSEEPRSYLMICNRVDRSVEIACTITIPCIARY